MGELMTAHVSPALKTYATWIGQMSCVSPIQKAQPSAEIASGGHTVVIQVLFEAAFGEF